MLSFFAFAFAFPATTAPASGTSSITSSSSDPAANTKENSVTNPDGSVTTTSITTDANGKEIARGSSTTGGSDSLPAIPAHVKSSGTSSSTTSVTNPDGSVTKTSITKDASGKVIGQTTETSKQ